jgi:hypothetical protein
MTYLISTSSSVTITRIDQQLHQPTPLLEGSISQSASHPRAEILYGTRHTG